MSNAVDLNKICYFLVTGASRGIGQTMAIECSKTFKEGSIVVLLARSKTGLGTTKSKILALNDKITVITVAADLSYLNKVQLNEIIQNSLKNADNQIFELAFIIHNIGTIGDVSKRASEMDDPVVWQEYFSLNVFSVAILNTQFMNAFKTTKKLIVNITSKAAVSPFKSFTLYCSGKAARQLYFQVCAEENTDSNNLIILNYSPGMVNTDMINTVITNTNDCDIKDYFQEVRDNLTILTTEKTTEKFLNILKMGEFKSGDRVDYYD